MVGENGWPNVRLGEVSAKIGSGATPRGGKESYIDSGISLIRSQNVYNEGFSREGLAFIDDAQAKQLGNVVVERNDVLINITGESVCRVCQVPDDVIPARVNQHVVIIRPKPKQLDAGFLRYHLLSPPVQAHLHALSSAGATRRALTKGMIEGLEVPVPPLSEQRAIAEILGSLEAKIELNRRMNETLESLARALFKSWFVDFDPVRAKMDGRQPPGLSPATAALFPDSFEHHNGELIPQGWAVERIETIAQRIAMGPFGSRITRSNFVESGVPVIRGNNLTDGFNESGFVFLTEEKADELRSANASPGDIVFTHRGTLGQVGLIPETAKFPRYVVSQSQMLLSIDESRLCPKLVYQFFRSPGGQQALLANTSQTGVPAIARPTTSLKAIRITVAPKAVSDEYERLVGPIDSARDANVRESETLAALRDTLLPRLLSGELRVAVAEREVEAAT
jgi:type I restriction enzyme S subunit